MGFDDRAYGGGGRRTYGGGGMSLNFPPFTRAIKWLIITNAGIFLIYLIVRGTSPEYSGLIFGNPILKDLNSGKFITPFLPLVPAAVLHGWIWQLVTYLFIHGGLFHILFNMLTLWMFGSTMESTWGHRQFLEFYFFCGIGAGLVTIAVSYATLFPALAFLHLSPVLPTIGASGAIYGVMIAFAMYYGNQEFMMFPLPFMIRAKYLVGILIFISLAYALGAGGQQGVAEFTHLGGALLGWIYVRFLPRRGLTFLFSENYYGIRNSYYKWKRRRAARKFEVYMRKTDRSQYFDQYGNYRPPDEKEKGNGENRGPWIN